MYTSCDGVEITARGGTQIPAICWAWLAGPYKHFITAFKRLTIADITQLNVVSQYILDVLVVMEAISGIYSVGGWSQGSLHGNIVRFFPAHPHHRPAYVILTELHLAVNFSWRVRESC